MKKLYIPIFLIILVYFTGCEDKQPNETTITIETIDNPREIFTDKDKKDHNKTMMSGTFTLESTQNIIHPVRILEKKLFFARLKQPLVLIHLFSTTCSPCLTHILSFSKIQKKYEEQLFVAGIALHQTKITKTILPEDKINFYITSLNSNDSFVNVLKNSLYLKIDFSVPLTILYKNGKLYRYYEGLIPIEMIEYDIQQAIL